ncbi:ring-hydroxylating dioxygenase, large terminal subunit [Burkholderia sp. Ch1-1]|uniref:Ring-hydroxylating dioxygenase, large terminal subunit n=1 Tax=Paraburkholderia dioscoreae TaxID=2604047 RepID=A0A5Q4Z1H4_9BURK|nr:MULTISPECIES: aromatic ring-hydroxylating dioxygenase subunit alpha [Paraburkholderia]EIF28855.1 ring-hydroxylating dioxygenase, large terminal subunit [Burkholderia sp. Ch1-1]MDR8400710.1 aromatic ring-hydroxylating dioxygenase subunit alpha [Paraburkholderia sp. USG1]VVD26680.1 Ring-hydroxylating dioxygenase, large terminal subunit [Paraburkholderia dioscoreae]
MEGMNPGEGLTARYPEMGTGPIPVEPYVSPEYFAREKEAIFKKTWIHVGRVEEIPKPGDYFVKELAACDTSIIVVRNRQGEIRAMHNVCSHRLNEIAYESCGSARKFFCKFHGWAYDLDGNLTGVPEEQCFFDLDKSQHGLTRVACDVWQGFIFVNMDPNPALSLAGFMKPMFGSIEGYPFDKLTVGFEWSTVVNCNWKLALDAFQEAYHVAYVHGHSIADAIDKSDGGSMPPLDALCGEFHRRLSLAGNQKSVYGNPKALTSGGDAAKAALTATTRPIAAAALRNGMGNTKHAFPLDALPAGVNWTGSPNWLFDINVVFPDFYLSLRPNYCQAYNFRPISHNRTFFEARVYYPEMNGAGGRFFLEYMKVALRDVLLEDLSTLERTQRAAETGAKSHMVLQDNELLVRHNYHVVERIVAAAN